MQIHKSWQRLGYPFGALSPSYATALGSSGDRPAALAELMGILVNDGMRQPTLRIDALDLALRTRPITFVRRKSYEIHYIDKQVDPLGATVDETNSNGTYGYVWSAGNHTGGGVRVILYQKPFDEPCPYEGIAQTMIHELSHKFLGTDDEPVGGGPDVYGVAACKALAKKDPKSARNLADCWGYYYILSLIHI